MDPHLRDLRYFVAVAEELHFTNAAQRLHIAQPTLSRQIRQLERQLDVVLFDRNQRSVALTVAGKELLEGARKILELWEITNVSLQEAGEVLRVGIQSALGRGLLNDLESASGHRLALHAASWTDPSSGLSGRQADLALVWLPLPDPNRYRWQVLRTEPRWVLLPENHPLADQETIEFTDLLDEPFVALPTEAGAVRDFWLGNDARSGRQPKIGAEAATPEDKLEAVSLGLGVCLLAENNVPMYRWPGLTARPVAGLAPCELAVAWRADDTRPTILEFAGRAVDGGFSVQQPQPAVSAS
ncbi:putative LysR family transcriptional regulator [Nocardia brasiliensis NBRC 14402]|uniref:LysR family transcriptional regulator n=1 Tax=Nocardia brasiliensis TaxID=37326 RepID=UPI0002EC116F|nr:LysR substrate-binding domain-containing protein [Nocardia brasiliensis]ASF10468.1 LysR family transcriptional regulator [Nocardia brasiliensis]MBF6128854.1 LysR family transcriptional regulator [Nocardia brasiliensis]MBF6545872.1 LysR family transcriptional regulator [Nocardia brasiliensis]SUB11030.1 HTH-type transcriptional regulator gltC [Nocardia brasiliensis]GAJ80374.1 putative LysR family transcriptional regulator [Nocardia brasiliensis NBRC 14402]